MLFIFGGSLLQSSSGFLIIPVVPFPSEKTHQDSQCCFRPFLGSYLGPCATPKLGNKFLCSIHVRYLPQIYDIWRLQPNMDKIIRKKTKIDYIISIYIYIYTYPVYPQISSMKSTWSLHHHFCWLNLPMYPTSSSESLLIPRRPTG